MAETANSVITDALELIVVHASEVTIEANEAQSSIRWLNRMMSKLAADGINLGYTEVDSLDDEITVAGGAIFGMISNLAITLFPQFVTQGDVPIKLTQMAMSGLNTMRNIAVTIGPSEYPANLPIGSGNEDDSGLDNHFYPDLQDTILAETGGSIALEDDTEEA